MPDQLESTLITEPQTSGDISPNPEAAPPLKKSLRERFLNLPLLRRKAEQKLQAARERYHPTVKKTLDYDAATPFIASPSSISEKPQYLGDLELPDQEKWEKELKIGLLTADTLKFLYSIFFNPDKKWTLIDAFIPRQSILPSEFTGGDEFQKQRKETLKGDHSSHQLFVERLKLEVNELRMWPFILLLITLSTLHVAQYPIHLPHIDFSGNSPVPSPVIEPGQEQLPPNEATQTCADLFSFIATNQRYIPTYPFGKNGEGIYYCTEFEIDYPINTTETQRLTIDASIPSCDPDNVIATCVVPTA